MGATEDRFRAIFESVNDAIFIHELPSGAILDVNERMCEMYGYTREEALLLDIGKLSSGVPPYTQQDAMRRVVAVADGKPQLLEWHAKKKSGELFWVEVNLRRATVANVNRVVVVVRDITERKRSEESARLGERRFTKMFEEAPIGIVLLDPERNVFASNRMFREFVGYSEEEIVAGGLKLFTYPEDMQAAIKLSDRLRAGEMPYFIMEHRYVRKDSKIVWAELSAVAIRDESGKLLHTITWVQDIDERKRAADLLRKSEAHYRTLVENSPDIIASFDSECRFLFVNSTVSQESPISPNEFIGKKMGDVGFTKEQVAFREMKIKEVFDTKIPFESEFEFSGHTGTHVFDWRIYPVLDSMGNVLSVFSISRNITERKRAEAELREAETKFRAMFEGSRDAILVSKKGVQLFANPAFVKLFGYDSVDEIVGALVIDHIAASHRQQIIQNIERRAAGEKVPTFYETRSRKKDGTEFDEEVNVSTYELHGEVYSLVIIRDVTERKKAEDALRESENRMRTIVEGTPHLFFYTQDTQGRITYVSPSVETITGRSADEWRSQFHWFTTKNKMNEYARELTQAHLRGEFTKGPTLVEVEHADKRPILLEVYENPIVTNGKVVGLQGVAHDITERTHAEEKMREQLSFQEFLSELSNEFAHSSGREIDHLINSGMEKACSHFGAEAAYILLMSEDEKNYSLSYEWHAEGYPGMQGYGPTQRGYLPWSEGVVFGGEVLKINSLEDIPADFPAEQAVRRDAGVKSVLIAPLHGRRGSIRGGIGVRTFLKNIKWSLEHEQKLRLLGDMIANVLERKRAEESLQTSLNHLHLLTARLENIREEERKSISHEVHDELGQILTAIRLDLATINESGTADENLFRSKLKSVIDLTDKAIEAVQQIAARLRPEILDYLGLFAAMEWQVDEFQKHSNVACVLHAPENEPEVDAARSTALFRILQEALTNVARHAKAEKVEVTFSESEKDFELMVADDGVGITEDQISNPTSFGLLGIKERLHPFKGTCTIKRLQEGGTKITVHLPKNS